ALERSPGSVAERCRRDKQHPLTPFDDRLTDQLAGDERLAKPDLVGHKDAVVLGEDPLCAPQTVLLKAGEMDDAAAAGGCFQGELVAVAFPQHPQIDQIRRVRFEPRLIQRSQVIQLRLLPQVVEPAAHLLDHRRCEVAEHELEVLRQPGVGEVGAAGDHTVVGGEGDERLAVQETVAQPPHLDLVGAQPVDQPVATGRVLEREPEQVAVEPQLVLVHLECMAKLLPFGARLAEFAYATLRLRRLGAEKNPHLRRMIELRRQQHVSAEVEVGRCDVELVRLGKRLAQLAQIGADAVADTLLRPVSQELGLAHPSRSKRSSTSSSLGWQFQPAWKVSKMWRTSSASSSYRCATAASSSATRLSRSSGSSTPPTGTPASAAHSA